VLAELSRQIAKVQGRSSDCRRDTSHKVSTEIARSAEIIVIEELAVANMMKNHNLAGSFADAGLGELLRQIDYKVRVFGGICLKAPRFFPSSKMCSVCQAINTDLGLNDREWSCGECGTRHDRDENAAKNLEWLGEIAASDAEVPASVTQWSRWFVEAKREIAEWRSLKQLALNCADESVVTDWVGEAIAEVKPLEIVDRGVGNQPSETVAELGTKQLETARDHLCSRFG
jgi:IS605 OrfB family transposase